MKRLFVGLPLPESLTARVTPMMDGLPGARWVPADNLHVTLRPIGALDDHQIAILDEALGSIERKPFELQIGGCGIFAQRRGPEAVWLGVAATPSLVDLQAAVERAAVRAGLAPEEKRFRPHITLARIDASVPPQKLQAFVAGHTLVKESVTVKRFTLFSRVGLDAAQFGVEANYNLSSGLGIDP
jgi:2'-5' RNA ligase